MIVFAIIVLLALASPVSAEAAADAPPAPPQAAYAFPLVPVVPADDRYVRRGEVSMVPLTDGHVLLVYANHAGAGDNARGFIAGQRLDRDARPVGEEWTIVPPLVGGMNVMSPAVRRLPDGRIGMLYSRRMSVKEASRVFITSTDEGVTWSEPVTVADGQYKTGCHDRFTITAKGRLLAPLHCAENWDDHFLHVRVARSDDAGKTWKLSGKIELPPMTRAFGWKGGFNESGCIEPGIAERADGSLLMTIRTAMGTQFCSESADGGVTWSGPRSMEVVSPQAPAHLTRVPGRDDLLLVWTTDYDARANLGGERHTITACLSTDGGQSWPRAKRKILVHDPSRSVDYPTILYRGDEVWIALRVSEGKSVLSGKSSTCLMRVPLKWFDEPSRP